MWFDTLDIRTAASRADRYWCNFMKRYCKEKIQRLYVIIDKISHTETSADILLVLSKIRKKLYYFNYILKNHYSLSKSFISEIGRILHNTEDTLNIIMGVEK